MRLHEKIPVVDISFWYTEKIGSWTLIPVHNQSHEVKTFCNANKYLMFLAHLTTEGRQKCSA